MRTKDLLSVAALTVCGAAAAFGQTPPSSPTSAPLPTQQQTIPSLPPYQPQPQTAPQPVPQSAPAPENKAPVVAAPAQQTPQAPYIGYVPYAPVSDKPAPDRLSSVYVPVDSWMYPALTRLYGMGFVNTMYLGMRPYTRRSILHMLEASRNAIMSSDNEQAQDIFAKLLNELSAEAMDGSAPRGFVYGLDSSYARFLGISGPILRDSYHLGQTINNDYGRPYQTGFNNIAGASTTEEWGPFSLYVRGEYQHAPSADGYSVALATQLSNIDEIPYTGPQPTIPLGPIAGAESVSAGGGLWLFSSAGP